MKKIGFSLAVLLSLTLIFTPVNKADEVDFIVSAFIPAANGVNIVASKVDSATDQFFQGSVSALNFDPMNFNSELGIWLPNHYFAIDVGVTEGAGSVRVIVEYAEGAIPDGQEKGLGFKSTATFVKITGPDNNQVETPLDAHGPKKLLKELEDVAVDISGTDLQGGFLRIFVGIFPGDDQDIIDRQGEPFTNADVSGPYDGTLTITATVA